jgi:hypothetical protein
VVLPDSPGGPPATPKEGRSTRLRRNDLRYLLARKHPNPRFGASKAGIIGQKIFAFFLCSDPSDLAIVSLSGSLAEGLRSGVIALWGQLWGQR